VTYGWDQPTTLSRFSPQHLEGRTIEDVEKEAVDSLIGVGFEPYLMAPNAVGMPGEYASEAILVPEVMRQCASLLSTKLMVVTVPKRARLVAMRADDLDQ